MRKPTADGKLDEYVTVAEAAALLKVSPWTLRNWDKAGRLKPRRHPGSGYRIYRLEDLEAFVPRDDHRGRSTDGLTPRVDWTEIGESEHFVQFYESDAYLMDAVSGYIATALRAGDTGIVIA